MKIAIIFFLVGFGEGLIVCDWLRSRYQLSQAKTSKK